MSRSQVVMTPPLGRLTCAIAWGRDLSAESDFRRRAAFPARERMAARGMAPVFYRRLTTPSSAAIGRSRQAYSNVDLIGCEWTNPFSCSFA